MMPNYDYSKDLTSDNKNGLVYVIDDDADVCESIKWLLESTNYRVEDYESGETFIAQFNESVPSVILCDLRMPGMSLDPQRYACIQAEQRELEQQYSTHITMARLCPYCKLRLETLCKGAHGATYLKCPQCGEAVFFPPVVFRIA